MTFAHEAVTAYPVVGDPDKATIRDLLTRRFAYCLAASESAGDFVAVDPVSGVVPLYLIQNSTMYAYDGTDGTTSASAVCLVTSDGKRYKTGTIEPPYSVLTRSTTAQPVSPADGARYLVPTAATGADWAGKDGKIAIYKGLGWHFAISPIGRELYIEDEDVKSYRNASGVWTDGGGAVMLAAGAVRITNVFGANASYVVRVENQTTNAEPTAVAGTNYIIGPSPTGTHWAGNAGNVAMCFTNGVWTIIAPVDGDTVYDKSQKTSYRYSSTITAWVTSAGAVLGAKRTALTTSGSTTTGGSGAYTYNSSTPPSTHAYTEDQVTLTYQAGASGRVLEFNYRFDSVLTATVIVIGLIKDAESSAVDWCVLAQPGGPMSGNIALYYTTVDAASATFKIRIFSQTSPMTLTRRMLQVKEFGS